MVEYREKNPQSDTNLNHSNNYKGLFKSIFPKTVSVVKRKVPLL